MSQVVPKFTPKLDEILLEDAELIEAMEPPVELRDGAVSGCGTGERLLKATVDGQELELPFQILGPCTDTIPHLDETQISRLPFKCPSGKCGVHCCLFMLATHIAYDHREVLIEPLWVDEVKTVLLDPLLPSVDKPPHCQAMFLLGGKIRGLWDGPRLRDRLPFELMSSKFSLHGADRIVLWITGPDAGGNERQRYTLEAGRNGPGRILLYAMAFSGTIVPLHGAQDAEEIHHAGAGLVIPVQHLEQLVDKRTKLLEVCVHFH
ncbi:uncharacterized protein LOC131215842 [Anopheles bellator]|uniref:uncharacterized protein LOC131215842 n=1 Tax=Anopheles bellator TaxID=139047 RepID=UPI00264A2440|nr:uncharacterized protein LOC131215842 [Anopheles bellator]